MRTHEAKSARGNGGRRKEPGAEQAREGMSIGLDAEARDEIARVLNRVLANLGLLLQKTKKAHWDVVGPQFFSLHKLWDEQYEELAESVDAVAERIRQIGGYPIATLSGWLEHATLRETPGKITSATEAVASLVEDHEHVARMLRSLIANLCDGLNDFATADFVTDLLAAHEQMAWMLRSFLQGTPVVSDGAVASGRIPELA